MMGNFLFLESEKRYIIKKVTITRDKPKIIFLNIFKSHIGGGEKPHKIFKNATRTRP